MVVITQVWLKGIWWWRKFDNILTMTRRIIGINSTIFPFHNSQRHVHQITIKNISINLFVIFFICSIIKTIYYNPVILTTNNLTVLEIMYSTISRLIDCLFGFLISVERWYFCAKHENYMKFFLFQRCPNLIFGYDQWL